MEESQTDTSLQADEILIRRILNQEVPLFAVLVRRYNNVLYRIARSYGFGHEDAEDLMQETHLAAYRQLDQFGGRASYKTWISKIMIHKCWHARHIGYHRFENPEALYNEESKPLFMENASLATESLMSQRELGRLVENCLAQIPLTYRTVFVLREVEGFSVAETAQLLDLSEVNVKVRMNRARTLLQKQIELNYPRKEVFEFNLVHCDRITESVMQKINNDDRNENLT